MKCPKCRSKSKVMNTIYKDSATYRYRTCMNKKCGYKFKTAEMVSGDWDYRTIVWKMKKLLEDVK